MDVHKLVAKKRRVPGLRLFKLDTKTGMVTDSVWTAAWLTSSPAVCTAKL